MVAGCRGISSPPHAVEDRLQQVCANNWELSLWCDQSDGREVDAFAIDAGDPSVNRDVRTDPGEPIGAGAEILDLAIAEVFRRNADNLEIKRAVVMLDEMDPFDPKRINNKEKLGTRAGSFIVIRRMVGCKEHRAARNDQLRVFHESETACSKVGEGSCESPIAACNDQVWGGGVRGEWGVGSPRFEREWL